MSNTDSPSCPIGSIEPPSAPPKLCSLIESHSCEFSRLSRYTASAKAPLLNYDGRIHVAGKLAEALCEVCSVMGSQERLAQEPIVGDDWNDRRRQEARDSIAFQRAEVHPLIRDAQEALTALFKRSLNSKEAQ